MRKGISLIVLVITIIVIVIISGSVILSLSNNNPINSAEEARFKSDLEQIQNELALYAMTQYSNPLTLGTFNINTMDGTVGAYSTAGAASKYASILSVVDGKLVIGGAATQKQLDWAGQLNVQGGTIITDTTKPVITLVGSNPMSINQNATYTEPGATCTDDTDTAIQSKLVITGTVNTAVVGTYTRTYNVTDASGNVANTVTRTVNIVDNTKPVITLVGSNPMSVNQNATYTEPGATCTDDTDTAIQSKLVITGTVNTAVVGTYTRTYNVTDASGNVANTVTRTVNVVSVGLGVNVIATDNVTINGESPSYNNPIIPKGFKAINTTDASWGNLATDWNNGLVIQDVSGNEFVWVPVDGTNVPYAKWTTTGIYYGSTSDDTTPVGFNATSITTTYKGFYVARYEAMFDYNGGNLRVASKVSTNKSASPDWVTNWSENRNSTYSGYLWNWINYTDSKMYAENMDSRYGYDTAKVGTNLITGAQWDTVMKWIQNSGKSVTGTNTWGNHSHSAFPANISGYANLQISGYSEYWKAKNIYDLAGNAWEWTNEKYNTYRIKRGGEFQNSGDPFPAAYRIDTVDGIVSNRTTFRVALYII